MTAAQLITPPISIIGHERVIRDKGCEGGGGEDKKRIGEDVTKEVMKSKERRREEE